MSPAVRNILAIIAGIVLGIIVNMGISNVAFMMVEFPENINREDPEAILAFVEGLPASSPLWLLSMLAHVAGTAIGGLVTSRIAVTGHVRLAIGVGIFFLIGGILNKLQITHPIAIAIADVVLYIPRQLGSVGNSQVLLRTRLHRNRRFFRCGAGRACYMSLKACM